VCGARDTANSHADRTADAGNVEGFPGFRGGVILPSFDSGSMLVRTATQAVACCADVWVVIDGSTDGSVRDLRPLATKNPGLRIIERPVNGGKGRAVLDAMRAMAECGFTHALVMDADGQHPASHIGDFLAAAACGPPTMVLGVPVFGPDAPRERIHGRRIANFFADLETLWGGVADSLFGFRVYPIAVTLEEMGRTRHGRRYDFDTEAVVRLFWAGVRPVNRPVRVFYPPPEEGGVTHFRYVRDTALLVVTHLRLLARMPARLGRIAGLRRRWRGVSSSNGPEDFACAPS